MSDIKQLIDSYTEKLRRERELMIVLTALKEEMRQIRSEIQKYCSNWSPGVKIK